jgi:HKD family nuclease
MMDAKFLRQDPLKSPSHLHEVVNKHFANSELRSARLAIAYVSWGGLSLIADSVEAFLGRSGKLSSIFGVDNGVTTPDALCYGYYLQGKFEGQCQSFGLSWNYCDSVFHPKLMEFEFATERIMIVGSSNLTNGGMAANHELGLSITVPKDHQLSNELDDAWSDYLALSTRVDPPFIRELAKSKVGNEAVRRPEISNYPRLGLQLPRAKKPLFEHILKSDSPVPLKHKTLSKTSSLTEKPAKLYLQILAETGGGDQVQLPVATLGTFFGIGEGDVKEVVFRFSGGRESHVTLTHFENNTHRIRLRPILNLPRPLVLIFERLSENDYSVEVVAESAYEVILAQHCTEQTRAGSRRWGLS